MNGKETLKAALDAVTARRSDYGTPVECLNRIALLWSALGFRINESHISGDDVALAMILLKAARQSFGHNNDNWIDIAGYAACGAESYGESDVGDFE